MPPIVAFVFGALCGELIQIGLWWPIQKGPTFSLYFKGAVGHYLVLAGAGAMFCLLWSMNALDVIVRWLPEAVTGEWASTGIPYTPQIGATAGFLLAFRIGKIADAFRSRLPVPAPTGGSEP